MVDTRAGQEKFKISVKHSVILKGKVRGEKCRDGVIAKEQISLAERVPSDPCWNNLNKVNIIIGLYTPTRYMNLYLHKWMIEKINREEMHLPYRRISIYRWKERNRKSLLEHHSDTYCKQDPLMNVILGGQNLRRKGIFA